MPTLKSPVSEAELVEISVQDIPLYKDPESGGYWLPADSLQRLADLQETPMEEVYTGEFLQEHKGRFSPETGAPLMEFEFEEHSGIRLDIDPQTGSLWLDEGELTRLLSYLADYEEGKWIDPEEADHIDPVTRVVLFLYGLTRFPPILP